MASIRAEDHAAAEPHLEPEGYQRLNLSFGSAACLSMLGVLTIAVAYTFGREHLSYGVGIWWVGQLLVLVPLFMHAIGTESARFRSAGALAALVGVETFMIKWFFNPTSLRWPDDLQHLRGMWNALDAGRVGVANPSLPISKDFPGLQSISACFSAMTGLSSTAVGLLLGGVAHVSITLLAYALFRQLFGSDKAGAVAALVYCTNSSFTFFNSYFVYENFAIPFMLLTMLLIVRMRSGVKRDARTAIATVVCFAATLVTHHITVFFLAIFFALIVIDVVVRREVRTQVPLLTAALSSFIALSIYVFVFRNALRSYFRPYTTDVLDPGVRPTFEPTGKSVGAVPIPRFDQIFTYLGFGVLSLVMVYGLWQLVRTRNRWLIPLGGFAALFAISLPVGRLLPFGGQIYGRSSTYVYLGVAFVFTVAALSAKIDRPRRRPLTTMAFGLAVIAGLAVAVPVFWERLPGNFYEKGYESGYDARIAAAARWVPANLPQQRNFMTDANGNVVLNTVSNEQVRHQGDQLFYLKNLDPDGYNIIKTYKLQYAWVDLRMATSASPSARYFYGASNGYFRVAPTKDELRKFDQDPLISRIYDDGKIRIYDMTRIVG